MLQKTAHSRRTLAVTLAVCALPLLGACEWLTGVSEPEELEITIESSDVGQVTLVTSDYFLRVPDPECPDVCERLVQLVESDTTVVSLPYQGTYPFTSRQQYFVETWPPEGVTATLAMVVSIDGEIWYDDFRELTPGGNEGEPETLRFVYSFNELTVP